MNPQYVYEVKMNNKSSMYYSLHRAFRECEIEMYKIKNKLFRREYMYVEKTLQENDNVVVWVQVDNEELDAKIIKHQVVDYSTAKY
jgi:hypothetical protein